MHYYLILHDNAVSKTESKRIMDAIIGWYFFSMVKASDFQITNFLKVKINFDITLSANEDIKKCFPKCYTLGDLRRYVYETYEKVLKSGAKYDFGWDVSELYKLQTKIRVDVLESFTDMFLGYTPTKDDYMIYIARAYVSGTFESMFSDITLNKGLDTHTQCIGKKIANDTMNGGVKQIPLVFTAIEQLTVEFREWFRGIHKEIIPISKDQLREYCRVAKVNMNTLTYSDKLGMVVNACMAKDCPFFLKVKGRLSHHMDIWDDQMPQGFHKVIRENREKSVDEIYQIFASNVIPRGLACEDFQFSQKNKDFYFPPQTELNGYDEDQFKLTRNQVMEYITKVRDAYRSMS